jgi:hypothetical protein
MNQTMKYICIALLALTTSCNNSDSSEGLTITNELLEGKWVLDSTNVKGVYTNEKLFFVDGKMYRCSYWRNGYFIDSATFKDSEINSYSDKVYKLTMTDTNQLTIRHRALYYYKKVREDDLEEALSNYRIGNRLKEKYIGYWKPQNTPTQPIKIMNHSPECDSVSFEIFNNGSAEFYINQVEDSLVHHSFRVRGDSPQFGNGCLIGDYGITWNDAKTQIGMVFSRFYADTIWFEKESR